MNKETLTKGNNLVAKIVKVEGEIRSIEHLLNLNAPPEGAAERVKSMSARLKRGDKLTLAIFSNWNERVDFEKIDAEDIQSLNYAFILMKTRRESQLRSLNIELDKLQDEKPVVAAGCGCAGTNTVR